jgi:hypothetical protein
VIAGGWIGFVSHHPGQGGGVGYAANRRSPDPRIQIVGGERDERLLIGLVDVVKAFESNLGVGMLVLR